MRHFSSILLGAALLTLGACDNGPSPSGGFGSGAGGSNWGGPGSDGGGGGGTSPTLTFDGPISADPSSPTSVAVQWHAASLNTASPTTILYDVFRADAVDMLGESLIATIDTGATSFVDPALTDGQTYFYRIVARTDETSSDNADVVSAHLPQIPPAGIDYATTIEPLWSLEDRSGRATCLTCHDGVNTRLDLTSWDGLMIGVGFPDYPDSFITPTQGEDSFAEMADRLQTYPTVMPAHKMWKHRLADFEANLVPWINEGATAAADVTPPTFDPADLADPAKFAVEILSDDRIKISFPHAMDPESKPYLNGTPGDHLEYRIYGGMDSNSIDWDTPLRVVNRWHFPHKNIKFDVSVLWPEDTGHFVVRAVDFLGNEGLEEAELVIERPKN